ncbi:MAG: tetratricopeptide repeat-containing sensor histidine kinase [Rufibacter sp.]
MVWFPMLLRAQQPILRDLEKRLTHEKRDTAKVRLLYELSKQHLLTNVPKAIEYAKASEQLASAVKFLPGQAKALNQLGSCQFVLGQFDKSFAHFFEALKIGEAAHDTAILVSTFTSLGSLSNKIKNYTKAEAYFKTAETLALATSNTFALGRIYNNQGHMQETRGNYAQALTSFTKAAEVLKNTADPKTMAVIYLNIGGVHTFLKQPAKGLPFLYDALAIDKKLGNNINKTVTLATLANAYKAMGQTSKSVAFAQESYEVALQTKSGKKIVAAAQLLENLYAHQRNFEQAYKFQTIAAKHLEELDAESQIRHSAEIIAKYESEKQALENKTLKAEKEKQAEAIEHQQTILILGGVVIVLMVLLLVASYLLRQRNKKAYARLRHAHEQVKQQNMEIFNQKEEIFAQSNILVRQNELLEKHNNFKSKIFSIVSHDLRSPFTTIKGIINLTKGHPLSASEVQRVLELLAKDVDVVEDMLNNLLVWSKNQLDGSRTAVDSLFLPQAVEDSVEIIKFQALQKEVTLQALVPEELVVLADREQLAFVFRNLLMNAIKFSFPGTQVVIKAKQEQETVAVSVIDQGKGISAKNLKKLFSNQRFTTRGTGNEIGTGLGLMLCKELLETMGGTISAHSIEGHGSTFTFTLPAGTYYPPKEKKKTLESSVVMAR